MRVAAQTEYAVKSVDNSGCVLVASALQTLSTCPSLAPFFLSPPPRAHRRRPAPLRRSASPWLTSQRGRQRSTMVGLKCTDGVVLGVEKMLISKMLVKGTNRRIHTVEPHIGLSIAGLVPDGRVLVNRARDEARGFKQNFGIKVSGDVLTERLAGYMHTFSLYEWLRPFGCGIMLAVWEVEGPALYTVEPDGSGYKYFGCALGKAKQQAKTMIESLNLEELTCRQAVEEIAKMLHQVHDELKDKAFELEMSWICEESGRKHVLVPEDVLKEAEAAAKAALESSDDDDDDDEVAMAD